MSLVWGMSIWLLGMAIGYQEDAASVRSVPGININFSEMNARFEYDGIIRSSGTCWFVYYCLFSVVVNHQPP